MEAEVGIAQGLLRHPPQNPELQGDFRPVFIGVQAVFVTIRRIPVRSRQIPVFYSGIEAFVEGFVEGFLTLFAVNKGPIRRKLCGE